LELHGQGSKGKLSAKLLCKISNCPDPLEYVVTCTADTPRAELSSAVIDFQRVLVGNSRQEELLIRYIIIQNIPQKFSQ
jgi:hypothetical protein